MTPFRPGLLVLTTLAAVGTGLPAATVRADDLKVSELRTQRIGDTIYFQIRCEAPPNYRPSRLPNYYTWWRFIPPSELARLPRLVPQDKATGCVYLRLNFPWQEMPKPWPGNAPGMLDLNEIEFLGKVEGEGKAKLVLQCPTGATPAAKDGRADKESPLTKVLSQRGSWADLTVTLDFATAVKIGPGRNRQAGGWPAANDLEGRWAVAQAAHFRVMNALSPDFGFYRFASAATTRKYGTPHAKFDDFSDEDDDPAGRQRLLYEVTASAADVADRMGLNRLCHGTMRDDGERTIDIAKVRGVTLTGPPLGKMPAGPKASPEPLARLVPHDNYYLHFKSVGTLVEAGDLFERWGSTLKWAEEMSGYSAYYMLMLGLQSSDTLARAYLPNGRDLQIQQRLEQQLCLKSTDMVRHCGPNVIKALAVTGSDPYVREGSDVTVIFHLMDKRLFQGTVDSYIQEARKKLGKDLHESKADFDKIVVESYVTPLREVSLHRAFFDDYAVYGNSRAGVRRIIDTYRGKRKALTDALDFQHLRADFRRDYPKEDAFLFVSEAFLGNLVGPALRIKERRRREALASLTMLTHAALLTAWETGKLPDQHDAVLAHCGLKVQEVFAPEGKSVRWDGKRGLAVSDAYNTLRFATPLIELPITHITPAEEREYLRFRFAYTDFLGPWEPFFDPMAVRLTFTDKQTRIEMHVLPLQRSREYVHVGHRSVGGTHVFDPATRFSSRCLAHFQVYIPREDETRERLAVLLRALPQSFPALDWLGNWATVRVDDSDFYRQLVEFRVRQEMEPDEKAGREEMRLLFQTPLTVGIEVRNKLVFAATLAAIKRELGFLVDWEPMKPDYKGVTIIRLAATKAAMLMLFGKEKDQEPFTPALYYAMLDDVWYISFREASLKDLIDDRDACRVGKGIHVGAEKITLNSSVYLAPRAAVKAKDALRFYVEWQAHKRALANIGPLNVLYRGGLLSPDASAETVQRVAGQYLGFVPVSPDGTPYRYDPKRQEVVNQRHGSLRQPRLHAGLEPGSRLDRMLEEMGSIRSDQRFSEDGIHTVITVERRTPK